MKSIIWVSASWVLSKCMVSRETWLTNQFYSWVKDLDGVDSLHEYISGSASSDFPALLRNELYRDAFKSRWFWVKPWTWVPMPDIDKRSYYIALNKDWSIMKDEKWQALYKYHDTWEFVDWSKVWLQKERKLWFFTRNKKQLFVAPKWYWAAKDSLRAYPEYIRKNHPNLMSPYWIEALERSINNFFNKIESWTQEWPWWETLYNIFTSDKWNHWYLVSKMMPRTFDRMLSDKDVAEQMLWYNFVDISFREFSESAAAR